jgi:hypothetical protein
MIGIINQIQASITSEAIDRLGRYDENEIDYIQDKSTISPSNQAIGMANTMSPPPKLVK